MRNFLKNELFVDSLQYTIRQPLAVWIACGKVQWKTRLTMCLTTGTFSAYLYYEEAVRIYSFERVFLCLNLLLRPCLILS